MRILVAFLFTLSIFDLPKAYGFGGVAFWAKGVAVGPTGWIQTLGGTNTDRARSITTDSSGNIYVAGEYRNTTTNTNGVLDFSNTTLNGMTTTSSTDVFVAKFDSTGSQLWMKTLGGQSTDSAFGIAVDSSSNVYVVGTFTNNTTDARSALDFAGASLTGVTTTDSVDIFAAKLDSAGAQQWIKKMGGISSESANSVAVDSSGNVYVTGSFYTDLVNSTGAVDFAGSSLSAKTTTYSSDVLVAKLDSTGTQQWIRTLGGTASEAGYGVAVDGSGNVYVAGYFSNDSGNASTALDFANATLNGISSGGSEDGFVSKLNSSGTQQWLRKIGGDASSESMRSVAVDGSGNVYVGGSYDNNLADDSTAIDFAGASLLGKTASGSGGDMVVAKLNSSGTQQWIKTLGGTGIDLVSSIAVDNSNVYLAGLFNNNIANAAGVLDFAGSGLVGKSGTSSSDALVGKLDSSGNQLSIKTLGGTGADTAQSVYPDGSGNAYVAGLYVNTTANASSVLDFAGSVLNGKTATSSTDAFVAKVIP